MTLNYQKQLAVPAKTATVAMWLFLASLAMLFLASMLAYLLIRFGTQNSQYFERTHLSWFFAASTVVVMVGSFTIHRAVRAIEAERQRGLKTWLNVTLGIALLFCVLQVPGMWQVWTQHQPRGELTASGGLGGNLAKLIAVFICLHALHVVGGVVYLVTVLVRAHRGVYDHEHHIGVSHAALYWHFLDGVWIFMYGLMLAFG